MARTARTMSSIRIVDDNERYRTVSFEGEADPDQAMDLHWRRRFQDQIQAQDGELVPLDRIRTAYIIPTPEQVERIKQSGLIPSEHAGTRAVEVPVQHAEFNGVVYINGQSLKNLDKRQVLAYFDEVLKPGLRELGASLDDARLVFVFNRLT